MPSSTVRRRPAPYIGACLEPKYREDVELLLGPGWPAGPWRSRRGCTTAGRKCIVRSRACKRAVSTTCIEHISIKRIRNDQEQLHGKLEARINLTRVTYSKPA